MTRQGVVCSKSNCESDEFVSEPERPLGNRRGVLAEEGTVSSKHGLRWCGSIVVVGRHNTLTQRRYVAGAVASRSVVVEEAASLVSKDCVEARSVVAGADTSLVSKRVVHSWRFTFYIL
jgi:hypothetical protein